MFIPDIRDWVTDVDQQDEPFFFQILLIGKSNS